MLPSFASDTIQVTEPRWEDHRGKRVPVYDADPVAVYPVVVHPGTSKTNRELREGVEIRYTIFAEPTVKISRHARVEVRGRAYRVEGEPAYWAGPGGTTSHVEIELVDWEG